MKGNNGVADASTSWRHARRHKRRIGDHQGVTAVYTKSERLDELRHAPEWWATALDLELDGAGAAVLPLRRRTDG